MNVLLFGFFYRVIAKLESNIENYDRIFGSMVSDYSGEFIVTSTDFSYVMIVKNGHYVLRLHRKKNLYIDNWGKLCRGEIDMYEYDINEILRFKNLI